MEAGFRCPKFGHKKRLYAVILFLTGTAFLLSPYKKIYFNTKMTARTYMRREIFSRLLVKTLMKTYEIMPKEIPSEML